MDTATATATAMDMDIFRMKSEVNATENESTIFIQLVQREIESLGFTIVRQGLDRPWGGFLVIDEGQAQAFCQPIF